ncbi:MAG: hypothetical protein M5U12_23075 [Verrucomicrobia bacterium]|nr:hypothetical protein [Verrucomicrobiota bacterium]
MKATCGPDFETRLETRLPESVESLAVQRPVRRIHLLLTAAAGDGTRVVIARLAVRHTDGEISDRPIRQEEDVRDWLSERHGTLGTPEPAWVGGTHTLRKLRLYRVTWENPRPEVPVETLALRSTLSRAAPILLAITLEP